MKVQLSIAAIALVVTTVHGQRGGGQPAASAPPDPVRPIVARLDLEKYKATVKGLTQFGDRRQGTERNRKATDWIEAQLRSYGCRNIARITYTYTTPPPRSGQGGGGAGGGGQQAQPRRPADPNAPAPTTQGGARPRGVRAPTGVNTDPLKQPNEALRALNSEPPKDGERQEVYCQKIGSTHPGEGYIVAGHMDGHGWGEAVGRHRHADQRTTQIEK
jgi:hypothetical protein